MIIVIIWYVKPMKTTAKKKIINISAVSGRIVYPFMGAYAASKHALEALSDAMRRELSIYDDLEVIVIQPGTIKTAIWDKVNDIDVSHFQDSAYEPLVTRMKAIMLKKVENGIPMEKLCEVVDHALRSSKPKTRYALPSKKITGWLLPRILPDRWVDSMIKKRMGINR